MVTVPICHHYSLHQTWFLFVQTYWHVWWAQQYTMWSLGFWYEATMWIRCFRCMKEGPHQYVLTDCPAVYIGILSICWQKPYNTLMINTWKLKKNSFVYILDKYDFQFYFYHAVPEAGGGVGTIFELVSTNDFWMVFNTNPLTKSIYLSIIVFIRWWPFFITSCH